MRLYMPKEDYTELGYWKNKNLYEYFETAAKKNPEKIAVVDSENKYCYRELLEKVQKLAGALKKMGVSKGDVVSFQLPNWVEAVVIFQAVMKIGAIANPIISIYREKEMKYILEKSNTKVLLIPYIFRKFNYLEMIRSLFDEIASLEKVIVIDKYNDNPKLNQQIEENYHLLLSDELIHTDVATVDEKTVALLLYTSGTTSDPKGVLHSHNTLGHELENNIAFNKFDENDVSFVPSPVGHVTGILYGLIMPFALQGKVVFQDIWDQEKAIQLLIEEECTFCVGAPPFLKGVVNAAKKYGNEAIKLKVFSCGGADVSPELIVEASKQLKNCLVKRSYGLSEHPTVASSGYDDPLEKTSRTDGKVLKGNSVKIVNENYEEVPIGTVGQIATKGPELFLGYIQEEYNEESFLEDGYFLTGDLALMDEDGYVEIKGRMKDIIIRGGENISVKEVEDLLNSHAKISDVAIVAMPDEVMGEKACAYVVLKDNEEFSFNEMVNFLKEQGIANQKIPERLEIIKKMPTTSSGKIQKYKLREDIQKKLKAGR